MRKLLLYLVTPAVVGGVTGFVANQVADYLKEEKKNDTTLRFDNLVAARTIVKEYADDVAKSPIKTAAGADAFIKSLEKKRRSLDNDDAKSKITVEIDELQNLRAGFTAAETEEAQRVAKAAVAEQAKRQGDAEAARRAQQDAADQAERQRLQQERADLAAQRFEERIRRAHAY